MGALAGGYLANRISRKYTLILGAVLFVVSAWGSGFADTLDQ
jgi:MFS family permease